MSGGAPERTSHSVVRLVVRRQLETLHTKSSIGGQLARIRSIATLQLQGRGVGSPVGPIALEPDDIMPYVMRAEILLTTGWPERAAADFRRAVSREPSYAEPYLPLGIALQKLGDFEGAAAAYQAFLDRAPRDHAKLAVARARLDAVSRR